jgi:Mg2+/Co2+ transporter CorC
VEYRIYVLIIIEDILEEIVGEMHGEFNANEIRSVQKVKENHSIFDSKLLIDKVNNGH